MLAPALLALGGCVFTSERPTVDASAQVASNYIFRGQVFTDRPVLQTGLAVNVPTLGGGTTTARAWGNLDLDDSTGDAWFAPGHAGDFTEIDLSLAYAHRIDTVELAAGLIHYSWPFGDEVTFAPFPPTSEAFLRGSVEVLGLRPAVTLHWDFDEVDSLYVRGEVARSFELAAALRLALRGWIGWSDAKHSYWLYRTHQDAWADAGLGATLSWDADDVTSVYADVAGTTIVDDDLRAWFAPRIDADNVTFSLGVAWAW
jgi:hypothetical protein